MTKLKLTKPILLIMGKTGSIGGSGKTNQKQINKKDMKTIDDEFEVNEDDEEMQDGAMYPAGLEMQGEENDREIRDDNDNGSPLDRDEGIFIGKDDDGMYPAGVK